MGRQAEVRTSAGGFARPVGRGLVAVEGPIARSRVARHGTVRRCRAATRLRAFGRCSISETEQATDTLGRHELGFTKERELISEGGIAALDFACLRGQRGARGLRDHFFVEGQRIEEVAHATLRLLQWPPSSAVSARLMILRIRKPRDCAMLI